VTLLEDIQQSAVDTTSDLAALLRKCKLLAARLGSRSLEEWVVFESNGYPDDAAVPEYRIWPLEVKGHFSGPFSSGIRNAPIPRAVLPKSVKETYDRYECRQSVAGIEAILTKATTGTVRVTTGDLALVLGTRVYQAQNCVQAWAEFGTGHLVELLNAVRNRVLDFALAVWKEAPEAGETNVSPSPAMNAERVTQIFNTTVYGGAANLVGSSSASAITFNIGVRDFGSLERVLGESGLSPTDLSELRRALEAEPTSVTPEKFGPKVSAWIAKMMGKAAAGGWEVGLGAGGTLLAQAIAKYYGL
jgi:hypothetical protein